MSKKLDGYSISRWVWDYLPATGAKPVDYALAFYISHLHNLNKNGGHLSLFSEDISVNLGIDTRTIYKALKRLENASFISIISEAKNQYKTLKIKITLGIPSLQEHLPKHLPIQKMQEQNDMPKHLPKHLPQQKMQGHSLYIGKELNTKYHYDDYREKNDELLNQFLADESYLESYCMNTGIKREDYEKLRTDFVQNAKLKADAYPRYSELIRHFANFSRKRQQMGDPTNSKKSLKSKQERALELISQKK